MKKIISALAMIAAMVFSLSGCAGPSTAADKGKATDYSRKSSWYKLPEITRNVDTFYIYSTAYYKSSFVKGAPDYATLDNPEMLAGVKDEYLTNASVYEESTNVFVPYYRQAGMRYAAEVRKNTGDIDATLSGISYDDIHAALEFYFRNCNNGRPFIIAGHSQGAAMVKYVLKHYFKEHPEYYKRMVAAYVIGFSVTKDDLKKYPHLKFATGENDTGVIISWNTEGPRNVKENAKNAVVLPNAVSINPLNWKLDQTYAPASRNLGSLMPNMKTGRYEITDIGADAQVVLKRGVIVTTAKYDHPAAAEFFGPQSYHEDDYTFYYNNLKDNVAKRMAAYQRSLSAAGEISYCQMLLSDAEQQAQGFDRQRKMYSPERAKRLSIMAVRDGSELLRKGKLAEAMEEFNRAWRFAPANPYSYWMAATVRSMEAIQATRDEVKKQCFEDSLKLWEKCLPLLRESPGEVKENFAWDKAGTRPAEDRRRRRRSEDHHIQKNRCP